MAGRVAVAYSGGRDSTALLHATLRAAAPLGVEVVALHVHHGLSSKADAWLAHCKSRCGRWSRAGHALQFAAERLSDGPGKGASVEAWARKARYAALRRLALEQGIDLVLLAHHRRDQAETLLLQALRGAGVAGLAGMPRAATRDGIIWARPWLAMPRDAIEAYVRRHRLSYVEDDSNANPRFARSRLRLQVWPQLIDAFPHADASLADAATWAHEATTALAELAALDLVALAAPSGLDVAAWSMLSPARRSNALRAWLRQQSGAPASASLVARLAVELPACATARWPLADAELRCHRGVLTWHGSPVRPSSAAPPETALRVPHAGTYALPGWGGALKATRTARGGVALNLLDDIQLMPRLGAEQFQAGPSRPPRSLKKQYQSAGVPAWKRGGPLLYSAGRLVFVPGLGIDARSIAAPGEAQLTLDWIAEMDSA